MLRRESNTTTNTILSTTVKPEQKQQSQQVSNMQVDRLLRKKRSKEYVDVLRQLDAGSHVNRERVHHMIDVICSEFPALEIRGIMLGIVATCYLGVPYEVHTLDLTLQVDNHYKSGQVLPDGLEKARSIALHGGYEFIEVYLDCCRAISADGSVSVIKTEA